LDASQQLIQDYAQAARQADIVIAEVGVWNNPLSPSDLERQAAILKNQACLALADEIGARCCVNIAGSRGAKWDGPHPDDLTQDTFEIIVQTVRQIIDAVQPKRTCYALETMPWMYPDSPDSYLAGGHHAYGHNDSWRVLPTWREALDAPGAAQLGLLKRVFLERKEWWRLVPDQAVFATGGNTRGQVLNLAARHAAGQWIMVYLGSKATVSIHLDKITAGNTVKAFWIDPRTGKSLAIGRFPNTGVESFSTPEQWEDALLILEASNG
jgi:hypothetical protein